MGFLGSQNEKIVRNRSLALRISSLIMARHSIYGLERDRIQVLGVQL